MNRLQGKRIIFLFGSLEMGGAERQGLILARYLKENEGAAVQVWGLGSNQGAVAEQCEEWGISWRRIRLHWGLRRRITHLIRLAYALRQAAPDILLPYTKVPNLAAALLWQICGAKLCVWNQSDAGLLLHKTILHRFAIGRINRFISNSEGGRQFLISEYGVPGQHIRLIRNGIRLAPPSSGREQWRTRLELLEGRLMVTMVANLSSYKDHQTLIKAWKRVLDSCNGSLPLLVLAGRFDDMADQLQHQVRQLGIDKNVKFLGCESDVSGLLQAADLAVHSSYSEGIPNAVLEAMAAGLAVVATDIPGIREAVGGEGADYLVPPGNDEVLATCLQMMLDDPLLRQKQGHIMRKRVQELFDVDLMCGETVSYLVESMEMAR